VNISSVQTKKFLECLSKLWIKNGVNDGVDAAIYISYPGGDEENCVP